MLQVTFSKDYVSSSPIFWMFLITLSTCKTESKKFLCLFPLLNHFTFSQLFLFLINIVCGISGRLVLQFLKFLLQNRGAIYIHYSCNIIFVKLCKKRIIRLTYQRCTKYLCPWGSFFFFLDSRLAKYVPVHSYSNTKVYPCGRVCNIYWSTLQRNLANHRPKVGVPQFRWALNMDSKSLNISVISLTSTQIISLFLPSLEPFSWVD